MANFLEVCMCPPATATRPAFKSKLVRRIQVDSPPCPQTFPVPMEHLFALRRVEERPDTFTAEADDLWQPLVAKAVFGGQIVAHALIAAWRTVPGAACYPHSIHLYFLSGADVSLPIEYAVDRLRDGKRYHVRGVSARQRGVIVAQAIASFHDASTEPSGAVSHRMTPPPALQDPLILPDERARLQALRADPRLPAQFIPLVDAQLATHNPVDVRYCEAVDPIMPPPLPPRHAVWMRMASDGSRAGESSGGDGGVGDTLTAAQAAFARITFASDYSVLMTALLPHGPARHLVSHMASLDHAIWFHDAGALLVADAEVRRRDRGGGKYGPWYLFELHSPSLREGRGYATGRLYTAGGAMLASVAQEGVVRLRGPPPPISPSPPPHSLKKVGEGAATAAVDNSEHAEFGGKLPPAAAPARTTRGGSGDSGGVDDVIWRALQSAGSPHLTFPAPGWGPGEGEGGAACGHDAAASFLVASGARARL